MMPVAQNTPPEPPPADPIVHMVATYKSARRLIVGVAVTFLVLLLVYRYCGNDTVERHSISAYYHNQGLIFKLVPVRNLFVGAFTSVALLLYAYKGYKPRESWLLNVAGVALLVVVICPMEWGQPAVVAEDVALSLVQSRERADFIGHTKIPDASKIKIDALKTEIDTPTGHARELAREFKEAGDAGPQDTFPQTRRGWAHYISAFVFFFCIASVCWFHAEDTLVLVKNNPRREKMYKGLYGLTGVLMLLVPLSATVLYWTDFQDAVFWIEIAGVGVFILYWSIKSWELSAVELPETRTTPHIRGI